MFNIDKALKEYKEQLKNDGLAPIKDTPRRPIYFKIKEYNKTKSLSLAQEIINDMQKYYVLVDRTEWNTLTQMASEAQALKEKQKKAAHRTNTKLTPQQLSDRNRKAAIARWNKVKNNKLIKDVK